jgi:hypothetical protein
MFFADDGPPDSVLGSTEEFQVTLQDGRVTVEMIGDYLTVDDAREVVEPYLRAWEIQAFLRHVAKHNDFQQPLVFQFDGVDIANPVPGPPIVIQASTGQGFFYGEYPSPPHGFEASPNVRAMWLRWQEYQAGRESLPSMAYFCLTVVESHVGGPRQGRRQRAAAHFAVAMDVLKKFGDLVSEVGGEHELRKAHAREKRPYSAEERKWIELVTLALMQRVGEVAHYEATGLRLGEQVAPITMADFP